MKRSTRKRPSYSPRRRKSTTARPSRGTISKKSTHSDGGGKSSSSRSVRPTYFSLLNDVEHALKHDHMEGASLQKIKRHLEKKYGGKPFDIATSKMLRSAFKRLHNRGRIMKHPKAKHLYKIKPPIVPAHHSFRIQKGRLANRQAKAKTRRPSRQSRPARRRRRYR